MEENLFGENMPEQSPPEDNPWGGIEPLREKQQQPPRRARQPKWRRYLRDVALLLCGLLCYAALVSLAALVWGGIVYLRQGDIGDAAGMPLALFLAAVFCSCGLVTTISRGGTIFPSLLLAVAVNILPFVVTQTPLLPLGGLLQKLLLTLVVAVIAFCLAKMRYLNRRR